MFLINQPLIWIPMIFFRIQIIEIQVRQKHHYHQRKHPRSNIIWEIQDTNQVRIEIFQKNKKYSLIVLGINPKQTVRGDNFNWLTDASNNSNAACM